MTYWRPYDAAMPWESNGADLEEIRSAVESLGVRQAAIEADLSQITAPSMIFEEIGKRLGSVSALILNHCHCLESDILSTSIESFDLHHAINARASWLLIREFITRFTAEPGSGRIVSITGDHTAGNLPYGASKGAMDRIVLASAREFRELGITSNVVNPGATDTGWMSEPLKAEIRRNTLRDRIGRPLDCANLVSFLCSKEGGWINAQTIYSNGGLL